MKSIPGLSAQVIRWHVAGETFSRGESYVCEGMVAGLTLRTSVLEALVHGVPMSLSVPAVATDHRR